MAIQKKKISIPNYLKPECYDNRITDFFDVVFCDEEKCSLNLLHNITQVSIITPVEFAKNAHISNYRIFPHMCISMNSDYLDFILLFSSFAKNIKNIAYRPGNVSNKFITEIIFKENYNIRIDFHSKSNEIPDILKNHDSIILSGDEAKENRDIYEAKLFLVEEWFDLTGIPFVSGIWVTKEDALEKEEADLLHHLQIGSSLNDNVLTGENGIMESSNTIFPAGIKLAMGNEEIDSLKTQFEYCFFHGFAEEIPDLKFIEL